MILFKEFSSIGCSQAKGFYGNISLSCSDGYINEFLSFGVTPVNDSLQERCFVKPNHENPCERNLKLSQITKIVSNLNYR